MINGRKQSEVKSEGAPRFITSRQEFFFPAGLLGFPACRHYRLEPYEPEEIGASPFSLLRSLDDEICFPLIHPDYLPLDYRLTLSPEALAILNARSDRMLTLYLIVTLRERMEDITVNLQGPLLLNPAASLGVQLVVEHYPVRYPLLAKSPI